MNKLKQYLPFIFPVAAIILVIILAVRWYNLRDQQMGQISQFAEGVEIENLSEQELNDGASGTEDMETVSLSPESSDTEAMGDVRYEVAAGKVRFSVSANLPTLDEGVYQVWLKDPDSDATRHAFNLTLNKGGYAGSAAISADTLPFEVIVSQELTDDDQVEEVLLRGRIDTVEEAMEGEEQLEETNNTEMMEPAAE